MAVPTLQRFRLKFPAYDRNRLLISKAAYFHGVYGAIKFGFLEVLVSLVIIERVGGKLHNFSYLCEPVHSTE
jgi:hypothetical protein